MMWLSLQLQSSFQLNVNEEKWDKRVCEHYCSALLIFINSLAEFNLAQYDDSIWCLEFSPKFYMMGARGNHQLQGLALVVTLSI